MLRYRRDEMVDPHTVKTLLSKYLLTEGFDFILDLDNSKGSWLVDERNGERYLDFFSMYVHGGLRTGCHARLFSPCLLH